MIRPTGIRLCDTDSDEHHLAGTVADVAFRGRGYEHAVDVPGQGRLTGIFAPRRAARGAQVGLRLDPAGCYVFTDQGDAIALSVAQGEHPTKAGTRLGA